MSRAFSRIVFPAMFAPVATTLTLIALVAFVGEKVLPEIFRFDPNLIVYCFVGLYLFSASYEAYLVLRGKEK